MASRLPLPLQSQSDSDDRHPLLGNEYRIGSPDRNKGPHSLFTFLSINGVIATDLHPNQLPHSIYDTPPARLVVSLHGIIEHVPPPRGTTLDLGMVADMKIDPRLERFSIWGKPILGAEGGFGLPLLPERRGRVVGKRTKGGKSSEVIESSVTRDGKCQVGKEEGKGKGERGDGHGAHEYRELASVAAHSPWCARDIDRAESGDRVNGEELFRYRELPSIVAHGAWCATARTGDEGNRERDNRDGGYIFERYSELPSVLAHGEWCERTEDEDEGDSEAEDRRGGYIFKRYSELPSVLAHGAWSARGGDGEEEGMEGEDD